MFTNFQDAVEKNIELDGGDTIFSVTFLEEDGRKHILCGSQAGVLLIDHGTEVVRTMLEVNSPVYAVAASKDGRWIVTGELGKMVVWDARTLERVHEMKEHNIKKQCVSAVDLSDDSTKVVSGSDDKAVRVFSLMSGKLLIGPILHDNYVTGVKFSPDGVRIATAAVKRGVGVFDVYTGVQLLYIPIPIGRNPGTPLAWSADGLKLFVVSPGKIVCFDASQEGLLTSHSEWAIQNSNSPISIVNGGRFIACSAGTSVSFWDPNSHEQLRHPIVHSSIVVCLAISSDGSYLVYGTEDQKITVHDLRKTLAELCFTFDVGCPMTLVSLITLITVNDIFPFPWISPFHLRILQLPLMQVSDAVVQSWTRDDATKTEVILSEEITRHPGHHAFANRALIRARLKQWNLAIDDATKVSSQ